MLDWKEIKGYDLRKDYRYQEGVELPELGEEILIQHPGMSPFVGYFKEEPVTRHLWTIILANGGMSSLEVQDGIKWAKFNRA